MRVFRDRRDAGAQLARALHRYSDAADVVVLAHTRASVPVAYEVATRLGLPLDLVAAEHGLPLHREICDERDASVFELELDVADRTVLLVDDGDSARTMMRMIERMRGFGARAVVAAVAVVSPQVSALLRTAADHAVCVLSPQYIYAAEAWYADHSEPSVEDIRALLVAAAENLLRARRGNFLGERVDT
jgi:putative phosphoribosyl transferase